MSTSNFYWLSWKIAEETWSVLHCSEDFDNQISGVAVKKLKQEGKDKDYWREHKNMQEKISSAGLSIFNSSSS
jgi:hypothetical protein